MIFFATFFNLLLFQLVSIYRLALETAWS